MKFLTTLFLASVAISPAMAQNKKATLTHLLNQRNHYLAVQSFMHQNQGAAFKTTGIKQRLIADASTDLTTPALVDSTNYHYNNSTYRGSTFDYNLMVYTTTYDPVNFPTFNAPSFFGTTSASVPLILCDTANAYSDNGSGLELSSRQFNTYVNNTQIADMKMYSYPSGSSVADTGMRYIHAYNAQAKLTSIMSMQWSGVSNSWDTVQKRDIYYNGQGLEQVDSISLYALGSWIPAASITYTYSGTNLTEINIYDFDGANWTRSQQYVNTYYPNGQLQTSNFNIDTGSSAPPVTLFRDTFVYNGTPFCTSWVSYLNQTGASLDTFFTLNKHLNSQNLPDTAYFNVVLAGASWIETFTYNSSNNPDMEMDMDAVGAPSNFMLKYYYENYNDLAVNNVPTKNNNITIYPNPASDQLNIQWKDANGTKAAISIVNAAGQVVYRDAFNWKQTTEAVSISNLQSGIYWISIADNSGNVIYRQSVVKK